MQETDIAKNKIYIISNKIKSKNILPKSYLETIINKENKFNSYTELLQVTDHKVTNFVTENFWYELYKTIKRYTPYKRNQINIILISKQGSSDVAMLTNELTYDQMKNIIYNQKLYKIEAPKLLIEYLSKQNDNNNQQSLQGFAELFTSDLSQITDKATKSATVKAENQQTLTDLFERIIVGSGAYSGNQRPETAIGFFTSINDKKTSDKFFWKDFNTALKELGDDFYAKLDDIDTTASQLIYIRDENNDDITKIGDVEFATIINKDYAAKNKKVDNVMFFDDEKVSSKLETLLQEKPDLAAKVVQHINIPYEVRKQINKQNPVDIDYQDDAPYTQDLQQSLATRILFPAHIKINNGDGWKLFKFSGNNYIYKHQIPTQYGGQANHAATNTLSNGSENDLLAAEYNIWAHNQHLKTYEEIVTAALFALEQSKEISADKKEKLNNVPELNAGRADPIIKQIESGIEGDDSIAKILAKMPNIHTQEALNLDKYIIRYVDSNLDRHYYLVEKTWEEKQLEIISNFYKGIGNIYLKNSLNQLLPVRKLPTVKEMKAEFTIRDIDAISQINSLSDLLLTNNQFEDKDSAITINGQKQSLNSINNQQWEEIIIKQKPVANDEKLISYSLAGLTTQAEKTKIINKLPYLGNSKENSFKLFENMVLAEMHLGSTITESIKNISGLYKIYLPNNTSISPALAKENSNEFNSLIISLNANLNLIKLNAQFEGPELLNWIIENKNNLSFDKGILKWNKDNGGFLAFLGSLLEKSNKQQLEEILNILQNTKFIYDKDISFSAQIAQQNKEQSHRILREVIDNILVKNAYYSPAVNKFYTTKSFISATKNVTKEHISSNTQSVFNNQNMNYSDNMMHPTSAADTLLKLTFDNATISKLIRSQTSKIIDLNSKGKKRVSTWLSNQEIDNWIKTEPVLQTMLHDPIIGREITEHVAPTKTVDYQPILQSLITVSLDKVKAGFDGNLTKYDSFDKAFGNSYIINCRTDNGTRCINSSQAIEQTVHKADDNTKNVTRRVVILNNPEVITEDPMFYSKITYYLMQNDDFVNNKLANPNQPGIVYLPWAMAAIIKRHTGVDSYVTETELFAARDKFLDYNHGHTEIKFARTLGDRTPITLTQFNKEYFDEGAITQFNSVSPVKIGRSLFDYNQIGKSVYHRDISKIKRFITDTFAASKNHAAYDNIILLNSDGSRNILKNKLSDLNNYKQVLESALNMMKYEGHYKPLIGNAVKPFISDGIMNIAINNVLNSPINNGSEFSLSLLNSKFFVHGNIFAIMPQFAATRTYDLDSNLTYKISGSGTYAKLNKANHQMGIITLNNSLTRTIHNNDKLKSAVYTALSYNTVINNNDQYRNNSTVLGATAAYEKDFGYISFDTRFRRDKFKYRYEVGSIIDDLSTDQLDLRLTLSLNTNLNSNKLSIQTTLGRDIINGNNLIENTISNQIMYNMILFNIAYTLNGYINMLDQISDMVCNIITGLVLM